VQLARNAGATVIGLASASNHSWLADHGIVPVAYGEGVGDRIREAAGGEVDALIDTFGGGYVELALGLGVRPERINTIIDFAAVSEHGVKAAGRLEVPVARAYPLAEVQDAFREVERRHTRGKIVLIP
jgi:NADPH:quinone reductase-like Zn-dependent oxidoreductase